jgi:hypothetical protein
VTKRPFLKPAVLVSDAGRSPDYIHWQGRRGYYAHGQLDSHGQLIPAGARLHSFGRRLLRCLTK